MTFTSPAPIAPEHDLSAFSCGQPSLDDWLRRRALANQESGASRTYVVTREGRVVAYYGLASGGLALSVAAGSFRRNMPDPIPVAILARLAIDVSCQRHGLGRALVRDAASRVLQAADVIGIRGMIVHALTQDASDFYAAVGFRASPGEPHLLMATLSELRAAL